ncbi:hypothetical protein CAPTEDRAFT_177316 [Capitella teleta]|uniref:Arrestin C-terminal-like domain-containing protein n=1 Tax=Capitella teleta TaxID=283909 RepID=R7TS88_CAPTE|nr:hypothetical protein CAPTEDRAFT_177316 [Capitella teleta]|eukprot:ELT96773.1 hypothetical protein CAPTEDRAFT_177316 [Capitella teleta]
MIDYIRKFDIELEREHYYAGETLRGSVVIENTENVRIRGVRVFLRGKAHAEWKITRGGERRAVKEDVYFIDEKALVWGKDKHDDGSIPILPRGDHHFPFDFQLPECALPCSFESRMGTIRYYLRVLIDIPYASPPQGLKYFTIIGPHIDCMVDRYMTPVSCSDQSQRCCLCCMIGPISLDATLDRSAYCCGENIKMKCSVENGSDQNVWIICRLIQKVEYRISKGVLGLTKDVSHKIWEYKGPTVSPHSSETFHDLYKHLQVPVMPPTLNEVCKVIEIDYIIKVSLGLEKSGEDLEMEFPVDIATVPFRIPNSKPLELGYEIADERVEGGMYISPEFQLGQVYDGTANSHDEIVLYRPVYVCVPHERFSVTNANNAVSSDRCKGETSRQLQQQPQQPNTESTSV